MNMPLQLHNNANYNDDYIGTVSCQSGDLSRKYRSRVQNRHRVFAFMRQKRPENPSHVFEKKSFKLLRVILLSVTSCTVTVG